MDLFILCDTYVDQIQPRRVGIIQTSPLLTGEL